MRIGRTGAGTPLIKRPLKIVGIYDDATPNYGYNNDSYAYIPDSTLPVGFENQYDDLTAWRYSFVLDTPKHQEAFVEEYKERLAELGISLIFGDNNGRDFWAAVDPLKQSALANVLIFGGVLTLALALAVVLYLLRRRRDFALLRALGVPRIKAIHQTLLPITLVGGVGIIIGGVASWRYSLNKAVETLSALPNPAGVVPSAALNLFCLVGLCAGIIALMVLFAWIGTRSMARRPVLELLQGGSAEIGGKRKSRQEVSAVLSAGEEIPADITLKRSVMQVQIAKPTDASHKLKCGHLAALVRHSLRHICRSPLKSLLTVAVALGFVLALGWIEWTMEKNQTTIDYLYDTTIIEVDIIKTVSDEGIPRSPVKMMLESGFVHEAYLEALAERTRIGIIQEQGVPKYYDISYLVWAFDQTALFFSNNLSGASIEYAPGWDESLFTKNWTLDAIEEAGLPAIFPEDILKQFDLDLGDELYLEKEQQIYTYIIAGQYSGQTAGVTHSFFGTDFHLYPPILLPLSGLEVMEGAALQYSVAHFELEPAKNRELSTLKTKMETRFTNEEYGMRVVFWDEELRVVIDPLEKNLSLLEVLYPVTIAVSVLIAAGLCLLLVMQTARVTAILRILGTPREQVHILADRRTGFALPDRVAARIGGSCDSPSGHQCDFLRLNITQRRALFSRCSGWRQLGSCIGHKAKTYGTAAGQRIRREQYD